MRKLTVVAAALTTLGLAGLGGPALATVPGPNGLIAFRADTGAPRRSSTKPGRPSQSTMSINLGATL